MSDQITIGHCAFNPVKQEHRPNMAVPQGQAKRLIDQSHAIILDLREKLARAEQERDAALLELASYRSSVTVSHVAAMLG